jgi:hypothetical protein
VGFFDFKAHSGLDSGALQRFLDRLLAEGYLKASRGTGVRTTYQATRKLHEQRPHDVLRGILMDPEDADADAA